MTDFTRRPPKIYVPLKKMTPDVFGCWEENSTQRREVF